jgi:aconitate hydratase
VVGKFVEFFGPGLSSLTLPDRATIANMAPEYGATVSFFPMDQMSLLYLSHTGRSEELIRMVEAYSRAQGLFRTDDVPDPDFSEIVELDLSKVEPSISGPKRPQDRMTLSEVKNKFINLLRKPIKENGYGLENLVARPVLSQKELTHGSVVIASITSCTNTSNPSVLLAAGLLAKKAVEFGLEIPSFVKTSLAPGSRVVTEYLKEAGLVPYLEKLGFHIVGYGCTTCIGNSGPLAPEIVEKIESEKLVAASVLSGNRNFEGRIHANVRANFLASPPLVIAYALAGRMDIDLLSEPLGKGKNGQDVFLKDLWPQSQEISLYLAMAENPQTYLRIYGDINSYNPAWNEISFNKEELFPWDHRSTYIQNPPFFDELSMDLTPPKNIEKARVLLKVGDSITTDHISPAGSISAKSPAGEYLVAQGVEMKDFNSYGSRRGNDRVMVRGTFANIRLKNLLAEGKEGGYTKYFPEGKIESVYSAAQKYQKAAIPLIVLAGKDYGMGSSRDWAAKGANLLGIKAVIADSYERIHRSNLVGMGVLPLQFLPGENCDKLGLSGEESYDIFLEDHLSPKSRIQVAAFIENGGKKDFQVILRIDTQTEIEYYQNGGILQYVLRKFLNKEA